MKVIVLLALVGYAAAKCPNACNGHGTCGKNDQCSCYRNWMGNDCSLRSCPSGRAWVDTPLGDLNGIGGVEAFDSGACTATRAWYDSTTPTTASGHLGCSKTAIWHNGPLYEYWEGDGAANEGHFYRMCSNKGFCDQKSGECDCLPGYEGSSCQRSVCPDDCNGHGTCESISEVATAYGTLYGLWDASKTYMCKCDPGYTGPSCAERLCPYGADPLTNADYEDANDIDTNTNDIRNAQVATVHVDLSASELGSVMNEYIEISFTDLFGETWTTTPITGNTEANMRHAGTLAGTGTAGSVTASATPTGVAAGWTFVDSNGEARTIASVSGTTINLVTPLSANPTATAFVAFPPHSETLAGKIEAALTSLPNSVIEGVSVNEAIVSGTSVNVDADAQVGDSVLEVDADPTVNWQVGSHVYLADGSTVGTVVAATAGTPNTITLASPLTSTAFTDAASNNVAIFDGDFTSKVPGKLKYKVTFTHNPRDDGSSDSSSADTWKWREGSKVSSQASTTSSSTDEDGFFGISCFGDVSRGDVANADCTGGANLNLYSSEAHVGARTCYILPDAGNANTLRVASQCSGRGLCDTTAGVCECFAGYSGDDCSVQNALAV